MERRYSGCTWSGGSCQSNEHRWSRSCQSRGPMKWWWSEHRTEGKPRSRSCRDFIEQVLGSDGRRWHASVLGQNSSGHGSRSPTDKNKSTWQSWNGNERRGREIMWRRRSEWSGMLAEEEHEVMQMLLHRCISRHGKRAEQGQIIGSAGARVREQSPGKGRGGSKRRRVQDIVVVRDPGWSVSCTDP